MMKMIFEANPGPELLINVSCQEIAPCSDKKTCYQISIMTKPLLLVVFASKR